MLYCCWVGASGGGAPTPRPNLVAYLRQLTKAPGTRQGGYLRTIVAACFPDLDENTIARLLDEALGGGAGSG